MNILILRTDKLGDFITALPAIYVLKQHDKNNKIVVCVAPLNKALALSCSFIDEVIIDTPDSSILEFASKIRKEKIDVSITLFSNTRVGLALALALVPKRIAPATKIAQIFYNYRIKQRRSEVKMAEFEYNLELTKEVFSDINLNYQQPLLKFEDAKKVHDIFCVNNEIEKEIVAFHVGFGGSSDANWNLDEYEILIREVVKQKKYQVVLTFGPDENELYEKMQDRLRGENIIFYLSLDGIVYFAKLLSSFKLFVSTSTGTYHLASLVACPTMTFFGDSLFASASRWKSVGDERVQEHFMLPTDIKLREKIFENIRLKLSHI